MNICRQFCRTVSLLLTSRPFSSCRSFNLNPQFEPHILPGNLANNARNNTLPRDYERMMQKVMFRVGPTTIATKRLKRMVMSKRETKFSEEARLSTPQGREIIYRRLLNGKRNLVPFGK
uniref:39S ribosomal protein L34, mitochondrial n=1 Tax=Mesocestoides corti TaxID=53468 RepID=A0A5K3EJ71_MESCO